jgi:hypothetical protein
MPRCRREFCENLQSSEFFFALRIKVCHLAYRLHHLILLGKEISLLLAFNGEKRPQCLAFFFEEFCDRLLSALDLGRGYGGPNNRLEGPGMIQHLTWDEDFMVS